MDSANQKETGVMDESCREGKRQKCSGRLGNYGPSASVAPMPLAFAPLTNAHPNPIAFASPEDNLIRPLTSLVTADGLPYRPKNNVRPENLASGGEHMPEVHDPDVEAFESLLNREIEELNMKIEEDTAREAQWQMSQFTSTFTELYTGFETSRKKRKDLEKQVTNLKGRIQILKDKEAHWDEKKKEIERERDEAREEARKAVNEKRILEQKLEKAAKQYKAGLGTFLAYMATGEGKSMGEYVKELVKETPCNNRAPADRAEPDGGM
ncbi:uncharacterized protein LOC141661394 [Apium graveolens]|uniref:uncharacterized protein LOC141661394 n=1 Tax=Apium graveolens TaxID=4045 RepID=UPI003D7BE298